MHTKLHMASVVAKAAAPVGQKLPAFIALQVKTKFIAPKPRTLSTDTRLILNSRCVLHLNFRVTGIVPRLTRYIHAQPAVHE